MLLLPGASWTLFSYPVPVKVWGRKPSSNAAWCNHKPEILKMSFLPGEEKNVLSYFWLVWHAKEGAKSSLSGNIGYWVANCDQRGLIILKWSHSLSRKGKSGEITLQFRTDPANIRTHLCQRYSIVLEVVNELKFWRPGWQSTKYHTSGQSLHDPQEISRTFHQIEFQVGAGKTNQGWNCESKQWKKRKSVYFL